MKHTHLVRRFAATAGLALAATASQAALVTLELNGSVTGYTFGDLSSFAPLGTAVTMSLTFNETFSDGSYAFSDDSGPASGTLSVGGNVYTFDDVDPYAYSGFGSALSSVTLKFLGSGPAPAGSSLFALFLSLSPSLTLAGPLALGFGFQSGNVTSYTYIDMDGSTTVRPAHAVPLPSTLALAALGLVAAASANRRRVAV